jgi:hypothetical protein
VPEPRRLTAVDDTYDPFSTDDKGYDKNSFYTNGGNRGDNEVKSIRLPMSTIAKIGEMIASRDVPAYKTEADFYRDAIVHRLHDVAEMRKNGDLLQFVNIQTMASRVAMRRDDMASLNQLVMSYEEAMGEALRMEDKPLLETLLGEAENDIEELRPTYQFKLRDIIKRYRGEYNRMQTK